jgi:hypothetical protein
MEKGGKMSALDALMPVHASVTRSLRQPARRQIRELIYAEIDAERNRQQRLQREGKFKYSCDSTLISSPLKLTILAEEFGEVAREVFEMHDKGDFTTARKAALRKELIQVAAVAVAWLETPEQGT